ncbi:IS1 family transposase, partial [Escherichia coli]|uniref:IS1 family transposase n=1 Tax=Escherichia coli TaxID=562 RepID=UPI002E7865C8
PLYESRLKGKLHVISKRYTQRIERHNLNLRQHLARLGRKSLSFSKSVASGLAGWWFKKAAPPT